MELIKKMSLINGAKLNNNEVKMDLDDVKAPQTAGFRAEGPDDKDPITLR